MLSERQRIEGPPSSTVENTAPPPPTYEEVNNGVYASKKSNGRTKDGDYFLGEVSNSRLNDNSIFFFALNNENDATSKVGQCISLKGVNEFCLQVIHSYKAESEVELNLSVGDCVVVRQVCSV